MLVGLTASSPAVLHRAYKSWCGAPPLLHDARDVALARKAAISCNLCERRIGLHQQPLRRLDSQLKKILMRRHAKSMVERASEVALGQVRYRGKFLKGNSPGQIAVHIVLYPLQDMGR